MVKVKPGLNVLGSKELNVQKNKRDFMNNLKSLDNATGMVKGVFLAKVIQLLLGQGVT